MYACFDQPDLKATFTLHGHRAGALGGRLQRPRERDAEDAGGAQVVGASRPRRGSRRTSPPWSPGRTTACTDTPRRHRPRALLPAVAGRAPRRRRALRGHQAGLRLVPPSVRLPLPVRQVRPALRAGVQRRRDGERRLRDVPARTTSSARKVTDARVRAARRDDPARDGAHVVRRPRDHALVGRPVAERVVRHLRVVLCQAQADPVARRAWTTFANVEKTWAYRQDQLPSTHPIAADIAGRARPPRSTSTASPTPRAPACSSSSSPTSGVERVPRRRCAVYFAAHAYGNTTLADLLGALEEASGRDLATGRSCGWRRPASTRCGRSSRSTTTGGITVVRRSCRAPAEPRRRPTLRPHRLAVGALRADRTAELVRTERVELDVTGARTAGAASWSASPSRPCCWSTTTT